MRRSFLTALILAVFQILILAQPAGYYDSAVGKTGEQLQEALHGIIDNHTALGYGDLWTAFITTDDKDNGKVWDMYSDNPNGAEPYEYTFGSDQCGNYSGEGSCYNREHSFPKSWFGGEIYPMNSDLFHLYPTDGQVNGYRGNFPFGETDSPTRTTLNGCKVGSCSVNGYNGTIFEPIDEYKGDFARSYFYMATRYYGEDGNWPGSPMVDGAQPLPWARAMLIQWHKDDPVSTKEEDRNDAVYLIQNNRNPFIDHPEYVEFLYEGGSVPVDELAPKLDSVSVITLDSLVFWFNEPLDPTTIGNPSNYQISGGVSILNAKVVPGTEKAVGLSVSGLSNSGYNIVINGVADTSGNVMTFAIFSFSVNLVSTGLYSSIEPLIYPNPNNGEFFIRYTHNSTELISLAILDLSGRDLPLEYCESWEGIRITTRFKPGVYLLNLALNSGPRISYPILVQ